MYYVHTKIVVCTCVCVCVAPLISIPSQLLLLVRCSSLCQVFKCKLSSLCSITNNNPKCHTLYVFCILSAWIQLQRYNKPTLCRSHGCFVGTVIYAASIWM